LRQDRTLPLFLKQDIRLACTGLPKRLDLHVVDRRDHRPFEAGGPQLILLVEVGDEDLHAAPFHAFGP